MPLVSVGDLVKVQMPYGERTAIVVGEHHSRLGLEYLVNPVDGDRNIICQPVDLELVAKRKKERK